MLTKIKIRNFKRFGDVEVDLGNPVVFIGPNNSGKTHPSPAGPRLVASRAQQVEREEKRQGPT